jgi:hypothetical protein
MGGAQVEECLPSKCKALKALSANPSTITKKEKNPQDLAGEASVY